MLGRFISNRLKEEVSLRRVLMLVIGSGVLTFGIHNIHQVVGITEGGMIGLLLLINHWFDVPASQISPLLDLACYAIGLVVLGGSFLGWSIVSSALLALFYALWEHLPHLLPDLSSVPLLAALLGGAFVGIGAGMVVRAGASAGGDDALALSISKLSGWRLSRCYLFTDLSVLALSLSYIPVRTIAYSLVTVCISSLLIERIATDADDRGADEREGVVASALDEDAAV